MRCLGKHRQFQTSFLIYTMSCPPTPFVNPPQRQKGQANTVLPTCGSMPRLSRMPYAVWCQDEMLFNSCQLTETNYPIPSVSLISLRPPMFAKHGTLGCQKRAIVNTLPEDASHTSKQKPRASHCKGETSCVGLQDATARVTAVGFTAAAGACERGRQRRQAVMLLKELLGEVCTRSVADKG